MAAQLFCHSASSAGGMSFLDRLDMELTQGDLVQKTVRSLCSPEMLGDGIFNVVHRGQWQHFWKEKVLQKTWSDWINAFIQKRRLMAETAANSVRLLIKVSRDTWRPSLRCGEPWCMQRFTKCFSKPRSSKTEKMFFFTGLLTDKLLQNCLPASCFFLLFSFLIQHCLKM